MLDIKFIRENVELVERKMKERKAEIDLAALLETDVKRFVGQDQDEKSD